MAMPINKGQFRLSNWRKNFQFNLKRGSGHLIRYAVNRFKWHYYPKMQYVSKFPDHVDIEIASACNLKCPMCYTITDEFKQKVQRTVMNFDFFKKLADECGENGCFSIRLSLRGEPWLNPHIYDMIAYAKERGIKEVSVMTNGLALDPEKFERLVDLQLDWLIISFDGLGETYERIRYPAKFEEAVEKIRAYKEIKERKKSVKPVVKIQGIWPAVKEDTKAFYDLFVPITDQVASNPLIDYLHHDKDIDYIENFTCPVLWQRLVIGSNGHVMLCSNDEMEAHTIGDVNVQSIKEIWHGPRLQEAREFHKKKMGVEKLEPCKHCYYPRRTIPERTLVGDRIVTIPNYTKRTQEIGK